MSFKIYEVQTPIAYQPALIVTTGWETYLPGGAKPITHYAQAFLRMPGDGAAFHRCASFAVDAAGFIEYGSMAERIRANQNVNDGTFLGALVLQRAKDALATRIVNECKGNGISVPYVNGLVAIQCGVEPMFSLLQQPDGVASVKTLCEAIENDGLRAEIVQLLELPKLMSR